MRAETVMSEQLTIQDKGDSVNATPDRAAKLAWELFGEIQALGYQLAQEYGGKEADLSELRAEVEEIFGHEPAEPEPAPFVDKAGLEPGSWRVDRCSFKNDDSAGLYVLGWGPEDA